MQLRQVDIEEDRRGASFARGPERLHTIAAHDDAEPLALQLPAEQLLHERVVVDDQHRRALRREQHRRVARHARRTYTCAVDRTAESDGEF